MEKNAVTRNKAFSEVKALGYEIVPIDINYAERSWTILKGKKFMPSFRSCKGVGDTAIDEIIQNRPYISIQHMLYDEKGKWKLSKFNKRSLEALIKIKAFESMDIIGQHKPFENYRHLHEAIIPHWKDIRKSLKKNPWEGRDRLLEKLIENRGLPCFGRKEIIQHEMEHLGSVNIETICPEKYLERFQEEGWRPIDDYKEKTDPYWFIVVEAIPKKTKGNKNYLRLKVMGANGKQQWMNCWGWNGEEQIEPYTVCVGFVSENHFGKSTKWNKLEIFLG